MLRRTLLRPTAAKPLRPPVQNGSYATWEITAIYGLDFLISFMFFSPSPRAAPAASAGLAGGSAPFAGSPPQPGQDGHLQALGFSTPRCTLVA